MSTQKIAQPYTEMIPTGEPTLKPTLMSPNAVKVEFPNITNGTAPQPKQKVTLLQSLFR